MTASPRRILIIEDNLDDRIQTRQMLLQASGQRYQFFEAETGSAGLKQFRQMADGPPDCVLMDFHLPDMDAEEILADLKGGAEFPPCPVVILTGSDSASGPRLLRAGAQDYLGKSWTSPQSITRAIENAVERFALISERKRVEEALRESEARFRAMAENIPQLAWMSDPCGSIFWYNQRWFDYTGTSLDEMQGWGWRKVHDPAHLESVTAHWKSALENGQPWEDTFPLRGKNGSYRWFLSRAFPIRNPAGQITRWFGTNTDITELRETREALAQAQEELARQNTILEETVEQRTARLRETVAELEAFSYSVSHDMRSPLRAMQGFSNALLEDYSSALDASGQDLLRRIHNAALRLDLLIQDVLSYSHVSKGELKLAPVRLNPLIRDIVDQYPTLQPPTEIMTEDPLPVVMGHPAFVSQILSNLMTNAVKFGKKGAPVKIRIRADEWNGKARIWVEDNGIGISPSHFGRIFQIFGRVYADKMYEGTGIGLAIVKKAVERMGGEVGVESSLGEGSKFWFSLRKAL